MPPKAKASFQPFGVIDIVAVAWKCLTENLKLYLEFVGWTTILGLLLWLTAVLIRQSVDDLAKANVIMVFASIPFSLALTVITLAMVQATWESLNRRGASLKGSLRTGLKKLIPFIWLSILTGLLFLALPIMAFGAGFAAVQVISPILAGHFWLYGLAVALLAALAGAMLMVPIYFALPVYFSADFLILDGIPGLACLKRCVRLVQGRWWVTLWRLVVPSVFFWLAAEFALKLAYLLMGSLAGDPGAFFAAENGSSAAALIRDSLSLIVAQLIYGLAAPLFVAANLIVWNDLKRLEGKG